MVQGNKGVDQIGQSLLEQSEQSFGNRKGKKGEKKDKKKQNQIKNMDDKANAKGLIQRKTLTLLKYRRKF